MSDKYERFRQYIADFLQGPNVDAMINTLADDAERNQDLAISVTDQLTISTASSVYLDKRLADKGITRPPELGMSDVSFRKMGIQITAQKQLSELIHIILETFYGEDTVRANIQNTQSGPYILEDNMELFFELEDGSTRVIAFKETDFINISQATASEVASVITRFIRTQNLGAFAQVVKDLGTNLEFVKIFGGAKGPYSTVTVTGGEANTRLRFPNIRGTELLNNDTAWEITRTQGSTLRFRWAGNTKPALDLIFPGDTVMIYGNIFESISLDGSFIVSNVRPPVAGPDLEAGWFEITNSDFSGLRSTQPGTNPPANVPPDIIYSYTVVQVNWEDLMFMKPVKALPNRQVRYALAWEPQSDLLRIYMPATTSIVSRQVEGAAHLHLLYKEGNLDGAFGSTSDLSLAVEVVSDRIIRYRQLGYDNVGSGGVLTWGGNDISIDYVKREQYITTIVCSEPHGLPVTVDSFNINRSLEIVAIAVEQMNTDDLDNQFLSPYVVDPEKSYTIRSEFVTSRAKVFAGSTLTTLDVDGILPNEPGVLLFDLNTDTEEGGIRYVGVQAQNAPNIVNIVTISQNGFTVTMTTDAPHGAVPGSNVVVTGTSVFDGVYPVVSVPNPTTIIATSVTAQVANQVGSGTVSVVSDTVRSTLLLDPSNDFNFDHDIGADITLLSDRNAYQPAQDGSDYPFYVTGVAEGRVFAAGVIEAITALGINIEILIVYPSDTGLGNEGQPKVEGETPHSDAVEVWGV